MNTGTQGLKYRRAAALVWLALGLSACGGGGGNGNVKSTPPTPTPPVTPPSTPPSSSTVAQPPIDAQLTLTGANTAHAAGYNGAGVTIGIVDSGVTATQPALAGRVVKELTYVNASTNNLAVDDANGHGTYVAEIAAGAPFGQFVGGIAPGANIVSARIIDDNAPDDTGATTSTTTVTNSDNISLSQVSADLIANGVKVMNNSWGVASWSSTDTATTQMYHDAYNTFINSWGGLVVFAAGNDSQANPNTLAALPSLAPDLEKGWLTVVAINSNNPTQLDSYSNQCGVAMNDCLGAPGDVIVSGKSDTSTANETYWIVEGTSVAAPEVSGAAALVWQAYPYFTNDLVRQTLLGTADPLGGSQPNPTFGYGEFDVAKAVNGPEQFNWGDVTVSFSGTSSWNNPISGAGGLIKQGTGTLTLTQPATFTGLTQVQGGMLVANSLASSVSIGAQGVLSSTPTVGGSITNAGVLAVGGNVTVGGNYIQQGAGRLAVSLGSALMVTGTASLTGGDLYVTGANQGYLANAHTDVLTAKGGLTGTFSALNEATGVLLTASLNYDANDAWLNVSQVQATSVTGVTYTPASFAAAQRVDAAFSQINSQKGQSGTTSGAAPTSFVSGAASLQQTATASALQQSLSSLSGQMHAASAAMTFDAMDAGTRALSSRFDQLGDVSTVGGWTQTLGDYGSMSRSGYDNVGYDLSGWMVGQDRRFGSNGVLGFAVSQSQDLGRLDEFADQGQSRAVEGMLYGGLVENQWYAMGRLGVGSYREDMRRHLELGSDVESVASDTNGRYDIAYGESGYRLSLGGLQVTPYLNLQYANIQTDGFDELGGDGFGLKAASQIVERWQAGAGLRAGHNWSLAGGSSLSLQTHLLWQRAFSMRGDVLDASFAVLNQWAPVGGIGLSRYGGDAGMSLDWAMSRRSTLSLGLDQYVAQHDHGKMDTLNYRLSF